jgi:hypothetical protein
MSLYEEWWFWGVVAAAFAGAVAAEPAYRRWAARARESALRRRLLEPGPGTGVSTAPGPRWSEASLPSLMAAAWIVAGPWTWGYADVDGAVVCDTVTGGLVALFSAASVVFPALLALNLLAGLWLVTAPWLVGFGTEGGPVGLSDVIAGLAICVLALRGLTEARRRLHTAHRGPIGRVRR